MNVLTIKILNKSKSETKRVRRFLMAYLNSYRRRPRPSSNDQPPLCSTFVDPRGTTTSISLLYFSSCASRVNKSWTQRRFVIRAPPWPPSVLVIITSLFVHGCTAYTVYCIHSLAVSHCILNISFTLHAIVHTVLHTLHAHCTVQVS